MTPKLERGEGCFFVYMCSHATTVARHQAAIHIRLWWGAGKSVHFTCTQSFVLSLAARVKACIKALDSHVAGFSKHKAKDTKGDPSAFLRYFSEMVDFVPKASTSFDL